MKKLIAFVVIVIPVVIWAGFNVPCSWYSGTEMKNRPIRCVPIYLPLQK